MSLTEHAIVQIKEMILSGELRPGARLPREEELAARLGLSRGSLREAVRALSLVKVIDVRQGDGTYVTSLKPDLLGEVVRFVFDFQSEESALHFLEVRRFLEPPATAQAACRISAETLTELGACLDSAGADATDESFLDLDRQFHRRILAVLENPVLLSLTDSLAGPTRRARIWRGVVDSDARDRTVMEHRGILEALAHHNVDVAAARAAAHIAGIEDAVRQVATTRGSREKERYE